MAVTRETHQLVRSMRVRLARHVDDTTRSLVAAWIRAWDVVAQAWGSAAEEAVAASVDGRWPSRTVLDRLDRAQRALDATRAQLLSLSELTGVTVVQLLPTLAAEAIDWHQQVVASQLPSGEGISTGLSVAFNRVDPRALSAIVERTTGDVASYLQPLSADAEAAMKRALIRGVAIGDNPAVAAREMVRNLEGEFNGGLARALNIARTEMLDANRLATRAADLANPDLVTGWYWWAALDERTCPSCWVQHGSLHPADEQGPDDHQSGRCTRLTATRSWADLGFDIPEPAPIMADAQETFWSMPERKQLAVMGQARLDALRSGAVQWSDLTVKRSAEAWRDSWAVRPVKDLPRAS